MLYEIKFLKKRKKEDYKKKKEIKCRKKEKEKKKIDVIRNTIVFVYPQLVSNTNSSKLSTPIYF